MADRIYTLCPVCARPSEVEALLDAAAAAAERGGDTWRRITTSGGRGRIQHQTLEAPAATITKVLRELRARCQAFLKR